MKSLAKCISKYPASFAGLVLILLLLNGIAFAWTFYGVVTKDYDSLSSQNMLETTAASASLEGIPDEKSEHLKDNHIRAVYLDMEGNIIREVEQNEKSHYMESTDDRLDLRHGPRLILIRQIVNAHNETMLIRSKFIFF